MIRDCPQMSLLILSLFKTLLNIKYGAFLKIVNSSKTDYNAESSSIIDVWQVPKYLAVSCNNSRIA